MELHQALSPILGHFVGQLIFVLVPLDADMPQCFSFFFFLLPSLFLFTSTQYSCPRITKSTAQSTQEAVWQGTRGSFSNIFFLSVSSFSLHRDFGLGWKRGRREVKGGERRRRRGVNQPPTSISNSLCSPHASRGSDLTLPRRKADPLQCFTTWWSERLNVCGCFWICTAKIYSWLFRKMEEVWILTLIFMRKIGEVTSYWDLFIF